MSKANGLGRSLRRLIVRCFKFLLIALLFIIAVTIFLQGFALKSKSQEWIPYCTSMVVVDKEQRHGGVCEEVHIATSGTSLTEARQIPTLVKSILYYSTNIRLHLHILTVPDTYRILNILFTSWELQNVEIHLYNYEENLCNPSLIGIAVAVHNVFNNETLPSKVLLLQSSHYFLSSFSTLFSNDMIFQENEVLIWIKPENVAYQRKPVDEHYIGLALFSQEFYNSCWSDMEISCLSASTLTDFIDNYSACDTVNDNSTQRTIAVRGMKVGNSKISQYPSVQQKYAEEEKLSLLSKLDGDLLRDNSLDCDSQIDNDNIFVDFLPGDFNYTYENSDKDACYEFTSFTSLKKRLHLHYLNTYDPDILSSMRNSPPAVVTLVSQLQFNRIDALPRLLKAWKGPASIALYLTDEEANLLMTFFERSLSSIKNVSYHVIYKRREYNPINYLRNIATTEALSKFILQMDVDFVPSPNLFQHLNKMVRLKYKTNKTALIVPSFETMNLSYVVPNNKQSFLKDLTNNLALPYHQRKGLWYRGHQDTNYPHWMKAKHPYKVIGKFGFEPYVVVSKSAPRYHEILIERMRDKLTFIMELQIAGYELLVLPDVFMVHLPHKKSDSYIWQTHKTFRNCTALFYDQIIAELKRKYKKA